MKRNVLILSVLTAACGGAAVTTTGGPVPDGSAPVPHQGVWPDEGPMKWTPRPTEAAITANDLRTRLYQISDDSMQGRKIGEYGNYRTAEYIASEFRRMGLRPAGENGTYFQTIAYGTNQIASAGAQLTVNGTALASGTDWIPMPPSGGSGIVAKSDVNSLPTVFAGRWGDTATALNANALRGRIAVFTAPTLVPPPNGGRAAGANGQFTGVRDSRAAEAGAAGVLVASLDQMRTGRDSAFRTRIGMQYATEGGIGAAAITNAAAQRIFNGSLDNLSIGTTGAPVTAKWTAEFSFPKYPARNIIAMMPGSDPARAGEYVLVGAHNDHNGVNARAVDHDSLRAYNTVMRPQGANDCRMGCTPTAAQKQRIDSLIAYARSIRPPRRDSIMNGADDDGSGTAVLMEIAEKFATERPARSIIFISHVGEEAGLLGSKWFVDHPTVPLSSIVAAHNMDMLGKGRVTDVKFGGPNSVQTLGSRRLSREFGDIIDSVNAVIRNPMAIDRSWDVPANPMNRFCRSDQVNYVHANIPVTYFSLGYARDYHQPTDEPQYIDYDHGARLGNFIHDVMSAIANRADKPAIAGPDPAYPRCG